MNNCINLIASIAFILSLSACARQNSLTPSQQSAIEQSQLSLMDSQASTQCQKDLRESGVIGQDQGFALVGDNQDVKTINANNPDTYTMTDSGFRAACANFGLYP